MTASTCSIVSSASRRALRLCALVLTVLVALSLSEEAGCGDEEPPVPLGVASETNWCEPSEFSVEGETDEDIATTDSDLGRHHHNSGGEFETAADTSPHSPLQDAPKQSPPA